MIPKIAYKDFLIKQEKLPKREDKNYVDFWMEHINYCKSGVSVGGIFISGWLYWHINFFKITIDKLDEWGNPVSEITNLDLRDNEWMIDYAFNKTDKDKKDPLTVVGTRRFAKTVFIASRLAYKAFIFQNSHIIIAGASATDISNITKYFDEYYSLRQDCFSDLTKVGDWNRSSGSDVEIAFSKRETLKKDTLTKKAGKINPITPHLIEIGNDNKYIFSRIAIRNLEHGQVKTKEELLAGITPTEVIWDEALDEDEIIPTMNGYKTVKELKINDFILGKNGKETKIVDKIDVGIKGIYEVSLMDGRKVKACGDHLWEVWDNDTNEYKVVRTSTIPLGQFSIDRCEGVVGNEESLKYSATKDKKRDEIKTVKYLHKKQAYCFKVDNEDSLFLAGQYVVTHNCGKYHWEKQHEALVPALSTKFGKRATEVLVGTGGNIDFSKDIEKAFLEPRDIGFYHFNLEEYKDTLVDGMFPYEQISDLKTGLFVPAQLSLEGGEKIIMPLSSFIKKTYSKQDLKDLEGFTIEVTDWKNATDKINNYLDISANKSDSAYKKAQMYYPFQPEDCFLHSGNNPFPVEEAKKMQNIIKEKGLQGSYYNLTQNEHGIVLNETDKQPITQYPYEGGSYDAPVVILEPPIAEAKNIKRGTYVAGFDGYKVEESQTTDSVGSIYIYKRKVGISGYQDQLVAYYSSRPSRFDDFHTQVLYLLKLYNAELLPETDSNLYNFLRSRNSLNYLADCRNLVEGITPNSKAFMNYGLPATKKNQEHYMKLIVDYTQENILEGIDEDGNEIYTKGIFRIQDPMLLEEMIKFGKLKNYDRLVAFGHALAWDFELGDSGITGGIQLENDKSITPLGIISKIKANRTKWR